MADILRLRKSLAEPQPAPVWPAGITLAPLAAVAPQALHAILTQAYANGFGSVPAFDIWWPQLAGDSEFDPDLVFVATDPSGVPVAVALCWNSGFIKDIAVSPDQRGKGLGEALLRAAFHACQQHGLPHVDLKVVAANAIALRLYRRVGMVEVDL